MNEEENRNEQPLADDDLNTTPPNPPLPASPAAQDPAKWEMPTPVFRQTSGYLPKGFAEQFARGDPTGAEVPPSAGEGVSYTPPENVAAPPPSMENVPSGTTPGVEPQPDVFEPVLGDPPPPLPVAKPKPKRGALGIILIVIGLLAAAFLLIIFLAAIYYFFLAPADAGSQF